jgi:hypothetical protein
VKASYLTKPSAASHCTEECVNVFTSENITMVNEKRKRFRVSDPENSQRIINDEVIPVTGRGGP